MEQSHTNGLATDSDYSLRMMIDHIPTLVVLGRSIHTDSGMVSYEPKMAKFLRKDVLYDHCCCAVALHLP